MNAIRSHFETPAESMLSGDTAERQLLLERIGHHSRQWFRNRLRAVLAHLDEKLFNDAVGSSDNDEQNLLFDTMRELRNSREDFLGTCDQWCGESLARSLGIVRQITTRTALGSNIRSDDEDEFIEQAGLDARSQNQQGMAGLGRLFDGLDRVAGLGESEPLRPELFVAATIDALNALAIGEGARTAILDCLADHMFDKLDELHAQVAGLMLDAGIRPSTIGGAVVQFERYGKRARHAGGTQESGERKMIFDDSAWETTDTRLERHRADEADRARRMSREAETAANGMLNMMDQWIALPASAMRLLHEGWRRVLVHSHLGDGPDSAEWIDATHMLRDFAAVWTSGRHALPPTLHRALSNGMINAGCDPLRVEIMLTAVDEELGRWYLADEDLVPPPDFGLGQR